MANGFTLNVWVCKRRRAGEPSGGAQGVERNWERIDLYGTAIS